MKLYIVRHAEAEEQENPAKDAARQLTARGRERMRAAAAGMRRLHLTFEAILTSPLARAAETAAIIAEAYDNKPSPKKFPSLETGIAPAQALTALAPFAHHQHLMIVGHEPQLSGLLSLLLSGSAELIHCDFKKGACAAVEVPDRFERGAGTLLCMLTARQLSKMRK